MKYTGFWILLSSLTGTPLIAPFVIARYKYSVSFGLGFVRVGRDDSISLNF